MSEESISIKYPKEVELNHCDREPIHLIGKIQSHGVLISGNLVTKKIIRCSENCAILFNCDSAQLIDTPLHDILPEAIIIELFEELKTEALKCIPTIINGEIVDIIGHISAQEFILEFEFVKDRISDLTLQSTLIKMVSSLSTTANFNELNQKLTNQVHTHFGYDRVMLYQFDKQWNGNVVAESKIERLESWLGLQYPATDIPAPARRLLFLDIIRTVKDVHDSPINIVSNIESEKDNGLDLSRSTLRAVSPIHIEYLSNMKVGATLTIPILFGKDVWGLIACHHYSPKSLAFNERISFKFLAKFFATQLQLQRTDGLLKSIKVSSQIRGELINQIIESWDITIGLTKYKYTLNHLAESDGAAICIGGKITSIGNCPSEEQTLGIIQKIKTITNENTYYTNHLSAEYKEAQSFKNIVSGVICVFISESRDSSLLWFRPEIKETVYWAGKPQDKSNKNVRISPRKSFEKWKEIQDGISIPWSENELAVTKEFRKNVMNFVIQKYDEIKLLNIKLKKAYDELESFSYSVSHDLRAPLRGIDGFAQIIKEDYYNELDDFGKSSIETIITSVQKMNTLIDDILAYSGLDQKEIKYQKFSMQNIFDDEVRSFEKTYSNSKILFDTELPEEYGDPQVVSLLIRNLLENALKYSSKVKNPIINIGVKNKNTFYIKDNGIGFDQKHKDQIFVVFNRLNNDNFVGSGIGLSIAKRVVDKHKGNIWAESTLGDGATFYFNLNQING